jgi:predicted hydrocarbon binding protein
LSDLTSLEEKTQVESDPLTVPAYGYELIREILIPELLGRDTPDLLYWAGKRIARLFPLNTVEEAYAFFQKVGWGNLEVVKQTKNEIIYQLSSELIEKRLKEKGKCTFQLEAGYLAQQYEQTKKVIAEAFEDPKRKEKKVTITVRWDSKDPVEG